MSNFCSKNDIKKSILENLDNLIYTEFKNNSIDFEKLYTDENYLVYNTNNTDKNIQFLNLISDKILNYINVKLFNQINGDNIFEYIVEKNIVFFKIQFTEELNNFFNNILNINETISNKYLKDYGNFINDLKKINIVDDNLYISILKNIGLNKITYKSFYTGDFINNLSSDTLIYVDDKIKYQIFNNKFYKNLLIPEQIKLSFNNISDDFIYDSSKFIDFIKSVEIYDFDIINNNIYINKYLITSENMIHAFKKYLIKTNEENYKNHLNSIKNKTNITECLPAL